LEVCSKYPQADNAGLKPALSAYSGCPAEHPEQLKMGNRKWRITPDT